MNSLSFPDRGQLNEPFSLQQRTRDYILNSRSENTMRAYRSDWADFEIWAQTNGQQTRPASATTVSLYITALAMGEHKTSTIQRRLVAISQAHRALGLSSPTTDPIVRLTMQGIRRQHGVAEEGKLPLLTEHIQQWAAGLGGGLKDTRDLAVILIGYAGAFRRSELVDINVEDVRFTRRGMIITIRRSKTDQEGEGAKVAIPFGQDINAVRPKTCPVTAVQEWIEISGVREGSLFRAISKGGKVLPGRLSGKAVGLIVKRLCKRIGLEPSKYGAHSLRAGHITQAKINRVDEFDTMRQSRHKSLKVFRKYIRDLDLFTDNSAGKLGL